MAQNRSENFPAIHNASIVPYPAQSKASRLDYLRAAGNGRDRSTLLRYGQMLLNPFHRELGERYPDETLTPTGITHFSAQSTYQATGKGLIVKILHQDLEGKRIWSDTYEGPIDSAMPQQDGNDYTSQYASYISVAANQRTLAYGFKVQITGLPPSTFVPAGRWYFLQLQENEMAIGDVNSPNDTLAAITAGPNGETAAISAVNAGKGFTITSQELLNSPGGIHIPYLPSGPQSLLFKDATTANTFAGNDNPWPTSFASGTPIPSSIYSTGTNLVIVAFGVAEGTSLTYSMAHHTEYIPATGAAGIIDVKCAESSLAVREGIAKVAQQTSKALHGSSSVQQVQNVLGMGSPAMRMSAGSIGDRIVGGVTTFKKVYDTVSPILQTVLGSFMGY